MKKLLPIISLLLLPLHHAWCAKPTEAQQVRTDIERVNDAWQQEHPAATQNAFWDNAAYHTGNIEAYLLTGNERWCQYSTDWAEHNHWKGARNNDPSQWQYDRYGEGDDFVMFGDWQVCFQTYIDLYNILPADNRIARARRVMEYQITTPVNDYWWWADGLYMVMPVMSKMYRVTGNRRYIDKMCQYLAYSDSIMLDAETGLYYRDAKYVYPAHTTASGNKDFWARGDGWVMAAFAKVLKDLPSQSPHYGEILARYLRMAQAVVSAQQPGGYWTRSMLDPDHAPGCETSGTAFFTYALLWGVNNGLLQDPVYEQAAVNAWRYLHDTAMQRDGSIGYVQPIGEKAIPGQVVDRKSTANFGTGAWLLAACEYVRYLERRQGNPDRQYWVDHAWSLAQPILSNMAAGTLQLNMEVEVSPSWDGRNIKVTYMEAFGRLMAGIAPWLALPDDDTTEGAKRTQLRQWALQAYANAVDPDNPDYLLWASEGQALVDAAFIAQSFTRARQALWEPLDDTTKQRYIDAFTTLRQVDPPYTNWVLFSSLIESFVATVDAEAADVYRVNSAIRKVEEWYTGDGWYSDGPEFAFDYYSSYVFHPMYLETLDNMRHSGMRTRIDYDKYYRRALGRAARYSAILERMISPQGTFPVFGRSITYRMGALQPLAMLAWKGHLPAGVMPGQVRGALTTVMHTMFDGKPNFNDGGYLSIGFAGSQPDIADWYTNNGSLYMTSLALLPLGLPATHPFWTDAALPTTQMRAWGGIPFTKDHRHDDTIITHDLY